jgi:hypothetical protein
MNELPLLAECHLDAEGLRLQRDRYRKLGGHAREVRRDTDRLTVTFSSEVDPGLLEETLAVESECCPFFAFDYSSAERRLIVEVSRSDQRPALDALAYALATSG